MNDERVAVIGDVHGKSELFRELINKVRDKYPKINIYTLGDLIDRGEGSKEVIQISIDESIHGIEGNHDSWLRRLVMDKLFDAFSLKPIMGGKATALSYGVDAISDGVNYFPEGRPDAEVGLELYHAIPKSHSEWLSKLPPYRKIKVGSGKDEETFWLIHAGLTESVAKDHSSNDDDEMMKKIVKENLDSILWTTPRFVGFNKGDNLYHFDNAVQVFGHRPVKKPVIANHFIAIDTGCGTCSPFTLTAIILPDREVIQVVEDC